MTVTRAVPIIRITNAETAERFYCGRLGFVIDFHYAAGPDGPGNVLRFGSPLASRQRA